MVSPMSPMGLHEACLSRSRGPRSRPGWVGGQPSESWRGLESSSSHSQVIENCPVTGIRVRTDDFGVRRVAAVETEHGSIQTPCVVNCAGGKAFLLPPEWLP